MTGTELKAHIAQYVPETLSAEKVSAFYANAHRTLSSRVIDYTKSDISCLATDLSVNLPANAFSFVKSVFVGEEEIDRVTLYDQEYFIQNGLLRYSVLGHTVYFTAPIGSTSVTVEYRINYPVLADGVSISFPDPYVSIFTSLYLREYYCYILGLVSMKRQNAPDVTVKEVLENIKVLDKSVDLFLFVNA
jgi:hypothetical protein